MKKKYILLYNLKDKGREVKLRPVNVHARAFRSYLYGEKYMSPIFVMYFGLQP
jgi:hypothetical protein